MITLTTIDDLTAALAPYRQANKSIGLVPTMGALHAGHASLVERAVGENDVTVVSDFVNPTQFNDPKDFSSYPRDLDADRALLETLHADILFAPTVEAIYPEPDTRTFDYPEMNVMEGPRRPGHFNGVCRIVSKLFQIVQPTRAYFGEKDFQQIAVVRAMVNDLQLPVTLCPCPIVREASGLALSSRNSLLTDDERRLASEIYKTLKVSQEFSHTQSVADTQAFVTEALNAFDGLEVEYFEIVDAQTLQPIKDWNEAENVQGCITVYCGQRPVRLIDNINYRSHAR
ncbi:pantoate--beta-alanine ligase [Alloprevotella tannerae]|uniref:pantoate--beta-alanine ligase n=1 Tax=Alloprevotella tannerae TaxID=76122 RepID=UPI002889A56D|nr:pantoate--beta-alanine ligase [Alloprevotella tannerae]